VQRKVLISALLIAVGLSIVGGFWGLWEVLHDYIRPHSATARKDLVTVFAFIAAGVFGTLTALAAVGNLYISRRNLQQQRELAAQSAQGAALLKYYEQMEERYLNMVYAAQMPHLAYATWPTHIRRQC
jgi:hypothetical protein